VPRKTALNKSEVEDEAKKETTCCSQGSYKSSAEAVTKVEHVIFIRMTQPTNTNVEGETVPTEIMPKTTNAKLQPAISRRTPAL
jgi:hypothetical protein